MVTTEQMNSVFEVIAQIRANGVQPSAVMVGIETGLPKDTVQAIAGNLVGVHLYPELRKIKDREQRYTKLVHQYRTDCTTYKSDETVDKVPDDKRTAATLGLYLNTVQKIIGGVAGVQEEHLSKRTLRKVYRKTRDPKADTTLSLKWGTVSLCILLKDYGVQPDIIADIVEVYSGNRPAPETLVRGTLYRWQSSTLSFKKMRIPKSAVRAIITAIVQCMPQPVEMIRQQLVHGSDEISTTKVNTYYPEFLFTPEMESLLRFVFFIVKPYTDQKISNEERLMNGNVFERSLYRTTDMGQQGRRFSLDDRADILDRTILMSFCPLICRSIPVTDKGNGLVIIPSCTVESWTGKHVFTTQESVARLTAKADTVRKYRVQGYKVKNGVSTPYTEEHYEADMAKIAYRKSRVGIRSADRLLDCFYVQFTCTQTGQKFLLYTLSLSKAEKLRNMKGIVAELDNPILYKSISGPFGEGNVEQEDTYLLANTVREYRPEGVFFRSLKFVTRTLFQFLFRRAVGYNPLADEDRAIQKARRNQWAPFSLYKCLEGLDEFSSIQLSTEEEDVLTVELMLPEQLDRAGHGEARATTYNRIRFQRTGYESTLTRKEYRDFRKTVYASILSKLEAVNEAYTMQSPAEMTTGPGPLSDCPVDNSLRIPMISGIGAVYSGTVDIKLYDYIVKNGVVTKKPLTRPRTLAEIKTLSNNPRIRRFRAEAVVPPVQCPCWYDIQTDAVVQVIEGTHDDVAVY